MLRKAILTIAILLAFWSPAQSEPQRVGLEVGGQAAWSANKAISFGTSVDWNTTVDKGLWASGTRFLVSGDGTGEGAQLAIGFDLNHYFGDGAKAFVLGENNPFFSYGPVVNTSWQFAKTKSQKVAWYLRLGVRHDMKWETTDVRGLVSMAWSPKPPIAGANYPPLALERFGFGVTAGAQVLDEETAAAIGEHQEDQ